MTPFEIPSYISGGLRPMGLPPTLLMKLVQPQPVTRIFCPLMSCNVRTGFLAVLTNCVPLLNVVSTFTVDHSFCTAGLPW